MDHYNISSLRKDLKAIIKKYKIRSIKEFDIISHEILIRRAMSSEKTSVEKAKELGIGKTSLYRKIKEYGIST